MEEAEGVGVPVLLLLGVALGVVEEVRDSVLEGEGVLEGVSPTDTEG